MGKRIKQKGKRFADKERKTISNSKKILATIMMVILITILVIEASLSFFSDVIFDFVNTRFGTVQIEMSRVLIEERDEIGRSDEYAFIPEVNAVPEWTVRRCKQF